MLHYLQGLLSALDLTSLLDAVLRVAAIFLCLTVHETCHGLAALALGDPTAKSMHRLSPNPLRHIDWIGLLMMFVAGFGWAKPVPVNVRNLRDPARDMMWVALAGPVTNFLLAIGFALVLGAVVAMLPSPDISDTTRYFLLMLVAGVNINLCLAWINLLPIPPLDGSKIVAYFLPPRAAWAYMSAGRYGFIILVLLLATGLLGHILGPLIGGGSDLLLSLVGIK